MGVENIKHKFILGIVLLILLVNIVKAEVVVDEATNNIVTFNVDYGKLSDNSRSLYLTKSITLKSTAGIENATFEVVSVNSDYVLNLDKNTLVIGPEGAVLGLNLKVPVNANEGKSGVVARIKVKYANTEKVFDIDTDVVDMLELRKVYVYVNDVEEKSIDGEGENVEDIMPQDKIKLRFVMDNNFDEDYDYGDMDVTASVTSDDSDLSKDIDEEADFTIDAGKKLDGSDEGFLIFEIPEKAEDGEYEFNIKVEGKDENKAKYKTEWKAYFKIERKDDDVKIESLTVSPIEVSCFRKVQITSKVVNDGGINQQHAALSIVNEALGINFNENFALNKGTDDTNYVVKQTWVDLDRNLKSGTYTINAKVFYDYTELGDAKSVQLIVKNCATVKEEAVQEAQNKTTITTVSEQSATTTTAPSQTQTTNLNTQTQVSKEITADNVKANIKTDSGVPVIVQTTESAPYNADDYLLGIIVVAVVFVIALIVMCVVLLMRD